jgi:hypothetical protein
MDTAQGFEQLWRVADSPKKDVTRVPQGRRLPIGQFGIGKLAAYVLAWRLTHVSKVDGVTRMTSMNFRRLDTVHQYDNSSPIDLDMRELTELQARQLLEPVKARDPEAYAILFGPKAARSWTVAALSDFKKLYDKLSTGRLGWVLSTGLPLNSQFKIRLNTQDLTSSKANVASLRKYTVGGDDPVAEELGMQTTSKGILIPGIAGEIHGTAVVLKKKLTEGKSDQYHRSHGFFVAVRGRIINLEDELFGLDALNHAAWARFSMTITAEGLREHLLSSREGVRESDPIRLLRQYLHRVFNVCRQAYEDWLKSQSGEDDVSLLLREGPSAYVTEPLIEGVEAVAKQDSESFYFAKPEALDGLDKDQRVEWVREYATSLNEGAFSKIILQKLGPTGRAVRYFPDTRTLIVNTEHPFVEKLIASSRNTAGAQLFGSSELLVDAALQAYGLAPSLIGNLMADRDRILRLMAGDQPSTALEVMRQLQAAMAHETALERATGMAFRVLGFEYEKRGGNKGGPDGVLYARLGRASGSSLADFKMVYDSKQSNSPTVPASKIDLASLDDFKQSESAQFGFFLAVGYEGAADPKSKINRKVRQAVEKNMPATLLTVAHLRRLVELHYRYGVTLNRLRTLFETAHTAPEVETWLDQLEHELSDLEPRVPLLRLLQTLDEAKHDELATPNVAVARYIDPELRKFGPERLTTSLQAVQTIVGPRWLDVDVSGEVRLHATAAQIVAEVERMLRDMFGVDASSFPEIK